MNLKELSNQDLLDNYLDDISAIHSGYSSNAERKQNIKDLNEGEAELLSRLSEGQKAIDRYELIRRLSPREFSDIYQLNISTGKPFDEIVDNLLPFTRGAK